MKNELLLGGLPVQGVPDTDSAKASGYQGDNSLTSGPLLLDRFGGKRCDWRRSSSNTHSASNLHIGLHLPQRSNIGYVWKMMGAEIESYVHLRVLAGDQDFGIIGGMIVQSAKSLHELLAFLVGPVALAFVILFHIGILYWQLPTGSVVMEPYYYRLILLSARFRLSSRKS